MTYDVFLQSKQLVSIAAGFDVPRSELNPKLFEFQRDITHWAIKRARAAIFADCGLGKTPMQLEWAHAVEQRTEKPVLIFAPLAVSEQTSREGEKFNISVMVVSEQGDIREAYENYVSITNYEKLDHFPDPSLYGGLVLDESSILKGFDGKTRKALTEWAKIIPYRLCCTATPAPNDYMELGNHAEFLGIMTATEMLSMFFVHDGGETSKWRLKKHATEAFWKWMASWAVAIRRPSDLGYDDGPFILPELKMHQITVDMGKNPDGYLFPVEARTLLERNRARKDSTSERVEACAALVNSSTEPWVIWCNLNSESQALNAAIDDAVEITGSDTPGYKTSEMLAFSAGQTRVLISKPSICGYGMNWQHCPNVAFVGLSDSYEQFYQSVRRCWRFGQTKTVNCYVITSEAEGAVVRNIERKEKQSVQMMEGMVRHMKSEIQKNIRGESEAKAAYERRVVTSAGTVDAEGCLPIPVINGTEITYREPRLQPKWTAILGDCVEEVRGLVPNSIDYSVFSPPFASLYTYSNSERDMGNSKDYDEFTRHFSFLVPELYRVLKPGRLLSFHCMNLPISKQSSGYIGIKNFRDDLIRAFLGAEYLALTEALGIMTSRCIAEQAKQGPERDFKRIIHLDQACDHLRHEIANYTSPTGFILHSECVIWKDPVTAMQRTKALGLLYKQLRKDSCMSRQGIPDYLVTMRKPGVNPEPVTKTHEGFPVDRWQRYASPVWMDIDASDTLQRTSAREDDDERHICPLQLQVIERAIELWTNPDDLVLSPFMGIGSEGHVALKIGRRFLGIELKKSYWDQAVKNLEYAATIADAQSGLFESNSHPIPEKPQPDVDSFLDELADVSKRHGLSIGHEDHQGAFLVRQFNEHDVRWLKQARKD